MNLSRLNRRRIAVLRANRRGWCSLWLFVGLIAITLPAEFIANDRPLLISSDRGWSVPVLATYTETDFGGEFETEADYRDPWFADIIESQDGWMLWPPIRYGPRTVNFDLRQPAPSPPSWENWFGTDDQARDVSARLIYGFRISVLFGFCLTFLSSIVGITAGAVQGFFGGWVDLIFQRLIEIWQGMPTLYLLIILASLVEPDFFWLLSLMLLFSWMQLVGVVRAEVLRARNLDFVRAARALGATDLTIMLRHVLPNAGVAVLTFLPFVLTGSVAVLASLDFLGFGLPAGSPSLGELLGQGKRNLHAPWLGLAAFCSLALLLSLLVFIGEAVRDAFDPRRTTGQ
ncbi:MAG: ABC transporter permease [Candidatus Latescibacterota bacterium]|nr:ABC transporter permease [Candidatus Latescibacterota bacterium]